MALKNSMMMGASGLVYTATDVAAALRTKPPGAVTFITTPLGNPITAGDMRNAVRVYETQLQHAQSSFAAQQLAAENHNQILAASAQWVEPWPAESHEEISLRKVRTNKKLLLCKGK